MGPLRGTPDYRRFHVADHAVDDHEGNRVILIVLAALALGYSVGLRDQSEFDAQLRSDEKLSEKEKS